MRFKSIMKKVCCVALALSCVGGSMGCAKTKNESESSGLKVVTGMPDYSADEDKLLLKIGAYIAPVPAGIYDDTSYITVERYKEMKEAGLDYVLGIYSQGPDNSNILQALDCAAEAGVQYMVRWDQLANYGSLSAEQLKEMLGTTIEHEACMGILVKDEPNASQFSSFGSAYEVYRQVTDKYFYVNLFPNYASREQLGTDTYRQYVNEYCAKSGNDMICADHYPFGDNGMLQTLSDGFLSNLEIIQKYSDAYDLEHWEYIQGMKCDASSKIPDYKDYSMQIYTSMCFGVDVLQYFCYFTPQGLDETYFAMIGTDGKRTSRYYDAQKINGEIHAFDHVYMNYVDGWKGVLPVIGQENEKGSNAGFGLMLWPLEEYERIRSVKSSQDSLIGCYKDKDGRDGFTIVNYTVPAHGLKNKIEIQFYDTDAVIYYRHGQYNLAETEGGKFEIELEAGEGIFAIPVKY